MENIENHSRAQRITAKINFNRNRNWCEHLQSNLMPWKVEIPRSPVLKGLPHFHGFYFQEFYLIKIQQKAPCVSVKGSIFHSKVLFSEGKLPDPYLTWKKLKHTTPVPLSFMPHLKGWQEAKILKVITQEQRPSKILSCNHSNTEHFSCPHTFNQPALDSCVLTGITAKRATSLSS
jgi:hypothetical protein